MKFPHHPEIESIQETATCHLEIGSRADLNGKAKKMKKMKVPLVFHQLPLTYDLETLKELPDPGEDATAWEKREHEKLTAIKLICDSLEPGQIEFNVARPLNPSADDACEYYRAVLKELVAFGFHQTQIEAMLKVVLALNSIQGADLEAARTDFLEEAN